MVYLTFWWDLSLSLRNGCSLEQPLHLPVLYCHKSVTLGSQDCSVGRYHTGTRGLGTRTGSPQSCHFHDSHYLIATHCQGNLELLITTTSHRLERNLVILEHSVFHFTKIKTATWFLQDHCSGNICILPSSISPLPSSPCPPIFEEEDSVGKAGFVSFTISSLFF